MTLPERRRGEGMVRRAAMWVLVGVVVVVVAQLVLSIVLGLVKAAITLVIVAALAWVVIVGPPDFGRRKD